MNPEKQAQLTAAEDALVEFGRVHSLYIYQALVKTTTWGDDTATQWDMVVAGGKSTNLRDFLLRNQGVIAIALIEVGEMDLFRTFRTLLNLWFHAKAGMRESTHE